MWSDQHFIKDGFGYFCGMNLGGEGKNRGWYIETSQGNTTVQAGGGGLRPEWGQMRRCRADSRPRRRWDQEHWGPGCAEWGEGEVETSLGSVVPLHPFWLLLKAHWDGRTHDPRIPGKGKAKSQWLCRAHSSHCRMIAKSSSPKRASNPLEIKLLLLIGSLKVLLLVPSPLGMEWGAEQVSILLARWLGKPRDDWLLMKAPHALFRVFIKCVQYSVGNYRSCRPASLGSLFPLKILSILNKYVRLLLLALWLAKCLD